ncbi:MAG: hypothetical protein EPO24_14540 [Bacteroidetes bacterium]|nr:MAG: hypothetical protein EPO24_14540 [Bacteroidota bacterium]
MKKILGALIVFLLFIVGCQDEGPEPVPPIPVVAITSFAGTVDIVDSTVVDIGATDDKGIVRVELYVNNTLEPNRIFFSPPYRWYWNVKNLPDSSLHTLYAKAYDADGNVSTSPVVIARILLLKPYDLNLSFINDTAAVLSFRDVSSVETGFEIEQSRDGVNFVQRMIVGADSNNVIVVDSFKHDSTFYYRIRALLGERKSEYSNIVWEKIQFLAPTNLRILYMNEDTMRLAWDDPNHFALYYDIYTTTNDEPFERKVIAPGVLRDTGVWNVAKYQTFKTYSFKIRARSRINLSDFSETISTPLIYPAPDNLEVIFVNDDEVKLQWRDNAQWGSFFRIERQTDNGNFTPAKDVPRHITSTTLSFSYQRHSTYTFRVYLYSALNFTAYSNSVKTYFRDELYAGGSFSIAGSAGVNNIARWNGTTWNTVGGGISSPVYSLRKYFERIFIGGENTVTAWDNKNFSTIVGSLPGVNEALYTMIDTNGQLYGGGRFAKLGNAFNNIGVFTGSSWSGLGTGMNGPIYAVSYFHNNFIAAGKFDLASNAPVYNIAKRTDKWESVGNGLPATIYSLAVYGDELYAGGSFQDTALNMSYLTKWNSSVERWLPVAGAGITSYDSIRIFSMLVFNDELYVAGRFNSMNGVNANNIAKWDGTSWQAVGSGFDGVVRFLFNFNNTLYASGKFSTSGSVGVNNIARWDGSNWVALGSGITGADAIVYSMGKYGDWYWQLLPE